MKRSIVSIICMLAMYTIVFGDTYWAANRPTGSAWSVAGNWTAGLPDTADRANFTNLQDTDWGVDVDTAAVLKKILVSQNYIFNGTGSITLQPASTAHWDKVVEVNQAAATTVFNADVIVSGTTDFVPRISNKGALTFNGALTTVNSANSARALDFEGSGTTTINGDLVNSSGIRFASSGLTSIIGGSGVTSGSGGVTLLSGRLELNRAQALVNSTIKMEGITLVLGADQALVSGANIDFRTGTILAQGFDQGFGTLDLSVADVTLDMDGTDSIYTFGDSSAITWGTAGLVVNNAGGATLRFAGAGLTDIQITQITLDGTALTVGDTWSDGAYLYITPMIGSSALYTTWVAGYDLSGASADLGADPDLDNMDNLLEYALGGNPTNSDASLVLPDFALVDDGGTNGLEYVYHRRLDAATRGLSYEVVRKDSLLVGSWTNSGITEVTAALDVEFEVVTNRISTATKDAQFMKLNVEFE